MQTNRLTRSVSILAVTLILAVAPALAQDCTNAHMKGRYAMSLQIHDFDGNRTGSAVGTINADGAGTMTEWMQTRISLQGVGNELVVQQLDFAALVGQAGNVIEYEVAADCQGTIVGDLGQFALEGVVSLANGGKEAFFQQTATPDGNLASGVLRSMEPSTADDLADIKALLDRVAVRNGLRP